MVYAMSSFVSFVVAERLEEDLNKTMRRYAVPVVKGLFLIEMIEIREVPDPQLFPFEDKVKERTIRQLCDLFKRSSFLIVHSTPLTCNNKNCDLEIFTPEFVPTQGECLLCIAYGSRVRLHWQIVC
jgi:hypothetical protein